MSVIPLAAVWTTTVGSSTRKLVLLLLADHADEHGRYAYPSVARIAERTELSERTVQRCLDDLKEAGLIREVIRGGHRVWHLPDGREAKSTLYELAMDRFSKGVRVSPTPADGVGGGGQGVTGRVSESPKEGVRVSPNPSLIHKNPSLGDGVSPFTPADYEPLTEIDDETIARLPGPLRLKVLGVDVPEWVNNHDNAEEATA